MQNIQFAGLAALLIGASFIIFTPEEKLMREGAVSLVLTASLFTLAGMTLFAVPALAQIF